jgi:hypothetical protein
LRLLRVGLMNCSACCQPESACREVYVKRGGNDVAKFPIDMVRMWANHGGACWEFAARVKSSDGQTEMFNEEV